MIETTEHCVNIETSMTSTAFWRAVDVLLKKPHVVNKRLWGCKLLYRWTCKTKLMESPMMLSPDRILESLNNVDDFKTLVFQDLNVEECVNKQNIDGNLEVVLEELLPKAFLESRAFQLIILRQHDSKVMFFDVTPKPKKQTLCPNFSYCFQLKNNMVSLITKCTEPKSYLWLKDTVLPQFIKWGEESSCTEQKVYTDSLALVCSEKYYQKYNDLKLKYGKEMVKIWPECTDPAKFVYEDIAIATYLLLLWEHERKELSKTTLQSFVDIGCGNGLLVYILAKEGHSGVGVDVRKRKIWDMYTHNIKLEEKTITPSDSHLFPETDWIIGNHSDELTPWIPVIAARSSYKCNFFLLPCCAFNFDGSKYQRQDSSISQYTEYLQYIHKLCEQCGFKTDIDRLKIPSTKRICLVGRGRTYPTEENDAYCNSIQDIINVGTYPSVEKSQDHLTTWVKDFKPREAMEKVRNCTQVDKKLVNNIVKIISNYLLEGCCLDTSWSIGKTVDLNEVVQLISNDDRKALKSECGGIQTLLRNNHQIFKVQSGKVQLRYPKSVTDIKNDVKSRKNKTVSTLRLQQKPCWFYNNHPQGCPLKSTDCSFLHVPN